jgi:hemerythrin-like metal-binding protein
MPLITWKDEMNVGVRELDDDHRRIIELLNQLYDGVLAGKSTKELVNIFSSLMQETKFHLAHEERLLAKCNFPETAEHHKQHDIMLTKGLKLQARFMSGSTEPFTMEAVDQTREWLEKHILESDSVYSPFLKAHGIV